MTSKRLVAITVFLSPSLLQSDAPAAPAPPMLEDVAPASGLFPPNGFFFFSPTTSLPQLTLFWDGGGTRKILRLDQEPKFNLSVVDPGEPKPGETYTMTVIPSFGSERQIRVQIAERDDVDPPTFDAGVEIDSDTTDDHVFTFRARPATDDIGLAGYALFEELPEGLQLVQSELVRDPTAAVYVETGANPNAEQSCFVLKAFDLAGNVSSGDRSVCASLGCQCLAAEGRSSRLGMVGLSILLLGIRRRPSPQTRPSDHSVNVAVLHRKITC